MVGVVALLTAREDWALLGRKDVVFEVPVRVVLLVAGLVHLVAAVWVFARRDLTNQSLILLWLGVNHVLYRAALAWLNASVPLTVLRVLGMKVGVHARTLDVWWKVFMAFLIVGSVLVSVGEWRWRKRLRDEAFLAEWEKKRTANER